MGDNVQWLPLVARLCSERREAEAGGADCRDAWLSQSEDRLREANASAATPDAALWLAARAWAIGATGKDAGDSGEAAISKRQHTTVAHRLALPSDLCAPGTACGALLGDGAAAGGGGKGRTEGEWEVEFSVFRALFIEGDSNVNMPMAVLSQKPAARAQDPAAKPLRAPPLLSSSLSRRTVGANPLGAAVGTPLEGKEGFPPVCAAAHAGRHVLVALLLSRGADATVCCSTPAHPSCMHLAAAGGHTHIARLLRASQHTAVLCADKPSRRRLGLDGARDARELTPLQVAVKGCHLRFAQESAAAACECGAARQMAGWGVDVALRIAPSARTQGEDRKLLLRVFGQAAKVWSDLLGRPIFTVVDPAESAEAAGEYTVVVDFGEWNVKNGYTAPAVTPNRWPLKRSGAAVFLRKRREDEVAPRRLEDALTATACHELGHVLGLSHHPSDLELMHFLGRPLGEGPGSEGWYFGPDTVAAAKWLYAPALSKTSLKSGYPLVCLDCYACGWWNSGERGPFEKIDAHTFRANAKPRHNLSTRRQTETLSDGSCRLITQDIGADDDNVWGSEDED